MYKNGNPCHISTPRGFKGGTQGLKCNMDRKYSAKRIMPGDAKTNQ